MKNPLNTALIGKKSKLFEMYLQTPRLTYQIHRTYLQFVYADVSSPSVLCFYSEGLRTHFPVLSCELRRAMPYMLSLRM